jgi:hypothetical protein
MLCMYDRPLEKKKKACKTLILLTLLSAYMTVIIVYDCREQWL